MSALIITDPKHLTRDQVSRPSSQQLAEVAVCTYEYACDLARQVRRATHLDATQRYRAFVAACLEGSAQKVMAIKRLGLNYISEVGAILRGVTEISVDFFWLASHYDHDPSHADQLARQFFLSRNRQFVEQQERALEALRKDVFLGPFISSEMWAADVATAKEEMRGVRLGTKWRIAKGITTANECQWDARCKRA